MSEPTFKRGDLVVFKAQRRFDNKHFVYEVKWVAKGVGSDGERLVQVYHPSAGHASCFEHELLGVEPLVQELIKANEHAKV